MRSVNLEYFKLAVESGSLTRAAKARGVKVSTLSRAIDKLEDELGLTLLERNHGGVRLTAAGDFLFHRITNILNEFDKIKSFAQVYGTGHHGVIQIGTLLPPISTRFKLTLSIWKKINPDVRIIFHEMGTRDLRSALSLRSVDVIFFTPYIDSDAVASLPFFSEDLILALSSDHPLHQCKSLSREEIRNETFLIQDWGDDYSVRDRYLEILGKNITLESHPAGKQSVFALVGAGYGMTLAVQSQAEQGFPGVIFRPLRGSKAQLQIHLGWDANRQDPVTGRFVAFVRDFVRQR
ncbi:LysR family transcriptional regulator [Gluconacetobacter liquefaciens]|uniref:DNA-binding transcriptional LysR family regulator n=1 Tax=Gluconacetobacter liquefaciens TaxID=89584 RepID=A0A370GB91_GLULI|nr:LysR family transcriptional regulator [Gluconacetobacter liquefaciens]MBB2185460.1 LysR family transcriptional regulator [Gluconacetobacter liquefaciens]RDI39263.1 DNA-binding transcriptional LysR family regulator [Gluconacetobacter liquefaciens]GEB38035.1 LysR family transcriptional regulator [Gluconacetobacter liquefaciens]